MIDYSKIATEYASYRQIHPDVFDNLVREGNVTHSSRILEVGCGTGNYIAELQNRIDCLLFGIDPSDEMLSIARKRYPKLSLEKGRAERLNFETNFFDLIFSVDVIHHILDRASFFQEANRVLKPGGRICTVTDSEWIIRNRRPQSFYFPESAEVELKRYPKIAEIKDLMKKAQFEEISETMVERGYELNDIEAYRRKVFSALLLITEEEFQRGIRLMEKDLLVGPIKGVSRYLLVWGTKPAGNR